MCIMNMEYLQVLLFFVLHFLHHLGEFNSSHPRFIVVLGKYLKSMIISITI